MAIKCEVFKERPEGFQASMEAAGCYCTCGDKLLMVLRDVSRPQGNTWCIPGGKLEDGEDAQEAVVRELFEETGLEVADGLQFVGTLYVRALKDHAFHVFSKPFTRLPVIALDASELCEARWVTLSEALELPLIGGGTECLRHFEEWRSRR